MRSTHCLYLGSACFFYWGDFMTKKFLIATPNITFGQGLKKSIESSSDSRVVDIATSEDEVIQILEERIQADNTIDSIIITSNVAKKLEDKRLDVLSDLLFSVRQKYPDIIIHLMSKESVGHPFLTEVVQMGIYNIYRDGEDLTVKQLISKTETPNSFADPQYMNVNESIQWRRTIRTPNTILMSNSNTDKKEETQKPQKKIKPSAKTAKEKSNTINTEMPDEDDLISDIENIPVKEKIIIKEKIVGSIFIGIVGVERNTGATHLSILLSNMLASKGHKVALIETNNSGDLFSIEYAYEGGKGYHSDSIKFSIKGIDHYKNITKNKLSELIYDYDFIILDIGKLESSDFFEEFMRSHIKLLTCHPSEWKRKKLFDFLDKFSNYNQEKWKLVLPFAHPQSLVDIKKDTSLEAYGIDVQSDPYEENEECTEVLESMLFDYLPTTKEKTNILNKSVLLGGGVSVAIFSIILIGLTLFK
jgi:hypothetical protein